ncbi:class I SAM-dependent methyltransferase [Photobacterium nomapromontoriensis]|uniref:class I SAM-dependent methyltransferase n=1 Tax=Photobacterium nomapromontoriensis TaxID=2910237 RepID=UPI003D115731
MIKSEVNNNERALTVSDNIAKKVVFDIIGQMNDVGITFSEHHGETYYLGDHSAECQAQIIVHNSGFYKRLLAGGSIAAAEAYIDGWWDSPDLTQVIKVIARNLAILDKIEAKVGWLTTIKEKWLHRSRRNNKAAAKQNIMAHYDLGNDFYRIFLDVNMLYSSGIYDQESCNLEDAQINKMDRLCQQLNLQPSDHLLEIGTGWGALAIHAAKHYGCRVTTTTISEAQYLWAKTRIEEEGLNHQITLLLNDYRDLDGEYDKVVSVEMIEAVGKEYLTTYLKKCQALLKPDGLMAIQTITIADQRYDNYSTGVDFIQKHIFPGGFLPSITLLTTQLTDQTDFIIRDIKDIGMDYARTLSDWHARFNNNIEQLVQQGFDERFIRMWRYYLCYCEGGFRERSISTVQIVVSRSGWRV